MHGTGWSPMCLGSAFRFLLVRHGSISGFFCCAHYPGTGVQKEAASMALLVELRNKSAAQWGNEDAAGSSRTAVC